MPPKPEDLTGRVFGKLTVLHYTLVKQGDRHRGKWRCSCLCGGETLALGGRLKRGRVVSCGCHRAIGTNRSHGMSHTSEHETWRGMKARCYNPNNSRYKNYAGRNIKVCDRWLNSFSNFYEDMGSKPSEDHTLERIDNDLSYTKNNCKWALPLEQSNNRTTSRFVTYKGVTKTVSQWAAICGLKYDTLHRRLFVHKWKVERALLEPVRVRNKNSRGVRK